VAVSIATWEDAAPVQRELFPRDTSAMPKPGPIDSSTILSVERTRLSYDRTLMSWIRTATSLITFGFSIYKFFQIEAERSGVASGHLVGPREFAIMMILMGLTSLFLASLEHRRELRLLQLRYPDCRMSRSVARLMAGLISVLGTTAFVIAILRQ
jgi:putative membrane protein